MERFFLETEYPPASSTETNTGVSNAALSATTTSNAIPTAGATQVVLEFDVVGDAGGARTVVFYVDSQRKTDSTVWRQEMVGSDAAPAGGEVVTSLYRRKYSFTTTAAATTQSFTIPLPALYHRIRVSGLTAAGAVAANVVSLHVRVRA